MTATPHENRRRGPLLEHLDKLEEHCSRGDVDLQTIFHIFGNDSHYVIIFFLILPFLQPIPLFGLSTPFGIIIALVAYFALQNQPPILPKKWKSRKLAGTTVLKIAETSERLFEKISFLLHPRWQLFFRGPFRLVNALLIIFNAFLLCLPLPIPLTNALPAWMIFFQALGHLEEDGLFIVLSYLQTVICLVYFGLIAFGFVGGFFGGFFG